MITNCKKRGYFLRNTDRKGFTLIELLAVIVILAIIALIATPIILNMINDAKKSAAKDSAYGYIEAIEYNNSMANLELNNGYTKITDGEYSDVTTLDVKVKGSEPTSGTITIEKGMVTKAELCINNYNVSYNGKEATVTRSCGGNSSSSDNNEESENELAKKVQLGDYIKMTPTSTSFTTDKAKTGYTSTQTINPSELNVWRVIKVNSDGTIDVVSENVSSTLVFFKGQTGYKNLVGYLNELASQYTNTKYVQSTRHMGYNGQTKYLTDTASTVDSTATTAPWTSSTGSSTVESKGGGDTLYTTDTTLVTNALGTLVANNPSGTASTYWLASRYYIYNSSTGWYYSGRKISTSGSVGSYDLYRYYGGFNTSSDYRPLRPILTLKSGIQATGTGTSEDPYVLE